MSSELTIREKADLAETIDDFVETNNIDKKILFLGSFVDFIENRHGSGNSSMYVTASILYGRILDKLHKDDDKITRGYINIAVEEYMERAGIDMDKYK
jgi:UDP-2,3-diacylglucosamine pyrophosphatase LpxH